VSRAGSPRRAAPARSIVALPVALLAIAVLLAWSVPPGPDDWDGLGFVASVRHFDLATFSPHPPGYPVYVALLRVASWVTPSAVAAAKLVAVLSGVLALGALGAAVGRSFGRPGLAGGAPGWAAAIVAIAVAACPLVWRCASAIGSEAPALACACVAAWGLSRKDRSGAMLAGAMLGLGLGVRASWGPLFLPMVFLAPPRSRWRACVALLATTLAWAVPFVWVVGPSKLVALSREHLVGHASRWGGTALTEPSRAPYLARDLFVDGLGVDGDTLGLCLAGVGVVAVLLALRAWRRASWRGAKEAAVVVLPYLAWIAVGQNLKQQPRHALPLVVALAAALAVAGLVDRHARAAVLALFTLAALRTAIDTRDRLAIAPPGAQLVALVRSLPRPDRTDVFGVASTRFFEATDLAARAHTVGSLSDVVLALGRLDRLPLRVLVTGELAGLADSPYPLEPFATLARPARIDRRDPTLVVYELRAPFLPAR